VLAVVEQLERDGIRLKGAYDRTNRNPSRLRDHGPDSIDRQLTSDLLGFCGPTGNTYGSIATVDYLLESTSAAAVLMTGHGRFVQDLPALCTASSLHAARRRLRAAQQHHAAETQSGRARARARHRQQGARQAQAIVTTVHNTPFAISSIPRTICSRSCSRCSADANPCAEARRLAIATRSSMPHGSRRGRPTARTTLTELAITLVRDDGLPFRTAHAIAQRLMSARQREPQRPLVELLAEASKELLGKALHYSEADLTRVLSARYFVEIRHTLGGPAPEETRARRRRRASSSRPTSRGVERHRRAHGSRAHACGPERRAVTRTYVAVIALEAAIIVALWWIGRVFS